MPTFKAITREIVRKEYEIEAESFTHAHEEFMRSNFSPVGTDLIEETLTWVIEDPDGTKIDAFLIGDEPGVDGFILQNGIMPPEDLQLLMQLDRDNHAKGARPVIESTGWEQARRLSDAGLIAIEQLAMGGRLHITRRGKHIAESFIERLNKMPPHDPDASVTMPAGATEPLDFLPVEPIAFEYYEVRPCLEDRDGCVTSYRNEDEYADAKANHVEIVREFWTIYGMRNGVAQDGGDHAIAIGDFGTKTQAHQVMNAILAPLAFARDAIREGLDNLGKVPLMEHLSYLRNGMGDVANDLDDIIAQSSNGDRL